MHIFFSGAKLGKGTRPYFDFKPGNCASSNHRVFQEEDLNVGSVICSHHEYSITPLSLRKNRDLFGREENPIRHWMRVRLTRDREGPKGANKVVSSPKHRVGCMIQVELARTKVQATYYLRWRDEILIFYARKKAVEEDLFFGWRVASGLLPNVTISFSFSFFFSKTFFLRPRFRKLFFGRSGRFGKGLCPIFQWWWSNRNEFRAKNSRHFLFGDFFSCFRK